LERSSSDVIPDRIAEIGGKGKGGDLGGFISRKSNFEFYSSQNIKNCHF